jgi:uncharacterized membrane protein
MLMAGSVVFLVVTAVGGYGFRWRWTGFANNDTLWDWLNLVLLPVTVACLPLWSMTRVRRRAAWRAGMGALSAILVVLVIGGYAGHWRWTGFAGNTLWDWLKLLLVPFVLPLVLGWVTRYVNHHDPADPA